MGKGNLYRVGLQQSTIARVSREASARGLDIRTDRSLYELIHSTNPPRHE